MVKAAKQIQFRSSLLIFVDEPGYTIFEHLSAIKQEVGLAEPLKRSIGLIFYQSASKRVSYAFFSGDSQNISNNDSGAYRFTLEDAVREMLGKLRQEMRKKQSPDSPIERPEPQIYIVGDSNEPSTGTVLEEVLMTVREVLSEPFSEFNKADIYYMLSGTFAAPQSQATLQIDNPVVETTDHLRLPASSFPVSTPPSTPATATSFNQLRWQEVNFSYLYPYSQPDLKETAYAAAACALFILVSTDITLQPVFKPIIQGQQSPNERCGTLCTCLLTSLLTFPKLKRAGFGEKVKSYCQKQLAHDLLDGWMTENMAKDVILPKAAQDEVIQIKDGVIKEVVKEDEIKKLLQQDIERKRINQAYKQLTHKDSTKTWAKLLDKVAEEHYETWKQTALQSYQETKNQALEKVKETIYDLWQGPQQVLEQGDSSTAEQISLRLVLARTWINNFIKQLESVHVTSPTKSTRAEEREQLERKVDEQLKSLLSGPALLGIWFMELMVLLLLTFMIFPALEETFPALIVAIIEGVLTGLSIVYFFCRPRLVLKNDHQEKLIQSKRNEIGESIEEVFKKEQQNKIIQSLVNEELPSMRDRFNDINRCLVRVRQELQKEADQAREILLDMPNDAHHAHIVHICHEIHLEKSDADKQRLGDLVRQHFLHSGGEKQAREAQLALYKLLFERFQARENSRIPMNEQHIQTEAREKALRSAQDIFTEQLGEMAVLNESTYSALLKHDIWPYLFKILHSHRQSPTPDPHEPVPLVFLCGHYPSENQVSRLIFNIETHIQQQYKGLKVHPVHTQNEGWFFVVTLFRDTPPLLNLAPSSVVGSPEPTP